MDIPITKPNRTPRFLIWGITIVGMIMFGLLILAARHVQETAARIGSQNNLKQIGLATFNYHDAHDHLPPSTIHDQAGQPLLSWRYMILPYVEADPTYRLVNQDEPWDSSHNQPLGERTFTWFRPDRSKSSPGYMTPYRIFLGDASPDGIKRWTPIFDFAKPRKLSEIPDGIENTIMVVEAAEEVPWSKPDELVLKAGEPLPKLGGYFKGGYNVLFADGSVRFMKDTISEQHLRILIGADDGQPVPKFD